MPRMQLLLCVKMNYILNLSCCIVILFMLSVVLLNVNQNGKLLRSVKSHTVAVVCLNWEEDRHHKKVFASISPLYVNN